MDRSDIVCRVFEEKSQESKGIKRFLHIIRLFAGQGEIDKYNRLFGKELGSSDKT